MPWAPELFTAPAVQRLQDRRRVDELVDMPYFDGLMAGEPEALVDSFAGEPLLYDPIHGSIEGTRAFRAFVDEQIAWLSRHDVSVEDVSRVVLEHRGFEEVVLHLGGEGGGLNLPVAIVAEHPVGGRIEELRIYFSSRQLTGHHTNRPPLLEPDPELRIPEAVREHQRALAEGGGVTLEPCSLIDDGHTCALEYNVVRRGSTELPPQAGVAVYVRGEGGELAAARIYGDAEPPSGVGT